MDSDTSINPAVADVTIIGAGLLGLFNALQFAKREMSVVLIDAIVGKKKSYKVGESSLIFTSPFLRAIGELDSFFERSFPKAGVWFCYGAEGAEDFDNTTEWAIETKIPQGWLDSIVNKDLIKYFFYEAQIVRPEAEEEMQRAVKAHPKITFLDSALVKEVFINSDDSMHEVQWQCQETRRIGIICTRWILDCSGRRRFLAKKFGHDDLDIHDEFQTTAVWAQFAGVSDDMFDSRWTYTYEEGGTAQRDRNTYHFWGRGYWIWLIRLSNNRISVGVTFDHRYPPVGKDYKEQFWSAIEKYPLIRDRISEDNMLEFRLYKNVQYSTDTFVNPSRYAMVGDSAAIIDAYYSQGISLGMVTSWHIANIIEEDLKQRTLNMRYIQRVNCATRQDWKIMRNMIKGKYSSAIADSRYFILTHLADAVIFSSVMVLRFMIARLLVETGGRSIANEQQVHSRMKRYLAKRLFLSQAPLWHWLPPDVIQRVQRWIQESITRRAIWRINHNVRTTSIKCIVRTNASYGQILSKLLFSRKQKIDISPKENSRLNLIQFKGAEFCPPIVALLGPLVLLQFCALYLYDYVDTTVHKISYRMKTIQE